MKHTLIVAGIFLRQVNSAKTYAVNKSQYILIIYKSKVYTLINK